MGCSISCGLLGVTGDALRERNLLEVSEAMFEIEGSKLRFKFIDGTALKEDMMFLGAVCTHVFC